MLTKPAIYSEAVERNDAAAAWVLRVEVSASITMLYSNTFLALTDGEVYPVGLVVDDLVHQAGLYQTASTTGTTRVAMSNKEIRNDSSAVGQRPSFIMTLIANKPAQLYLAIGNVASLSDCLKVFDGIAVTDPEYNGDTLAMELADVSVTDNDMLPNENIIDDFPGSIAAILDRQYPIALGELKHADAFHAGPMALAEEITADFWVLSSGPVEDVTTMWMYHQGFGDFMKNVEPESGGSTLAAGASPSDTTLDIGNRDHFAVGDRIVVDLGGVDEEYHIITDWAGGKIATLEGSIANTHGIGETVHRSYLTANDGTRASLFLMRRLLEFEEGLTRYKVEAYDLKGYVRPEEQAVSPDAFIHSHKHQTFVTVTSNSGQPVLTVASTIGMSTGQVLEIDPGGVSSETKTVKRITSATTVEFTANLTNTHSAGNFDVVRSQDIDDSTDVENFDNCRDKNSATYATINAAGNDAGFFGVMNLGFSDIDTKRSNVDNNVGFIHDYGTFAFVEAEPSITLSGATPAMMMVAGRGVSDTSAEHRFASNQKTASTTDEDSTFGEEDNLLMLSAEGAYEEIPTATNNAAQAFIDISAGQSIGFSAGSECVFGPGTAREEDVKITNIQNGTRINLEANLVNNHASGDSASIRTLRSKKAVGVFWALGTGDEKLGIGCKAQVIAFTTTGGVSIGDPIARVFDCGLYFTCYVWDKPFATLPIVYMSRGAIRGNGRDGHDPDILLPMGFGGG